MMAGYVYRGSEFDAVPKAAECGTRAGYKVHRHKGEKACDPCNKANNAYTNDWERRRRERIVKVFTGDKCGTLAGFGAHKYYGVPICDDCKRANSDYHKAYKAAKKAAA